MLRLKIKLIFANLILCKEKILYNGYIQVASRPNTLIKDQLMDKITQKTSIWAMVFTNKPSIN